MEESYGMMKKSSPFIPKCISPLMSVILDSFKIIFLDYPKLFFIIYVAAALPSSIIITSLSISTTPRRLKAYMMHLEWLSRVVPTLQETKNVWETSQMELRKLYHFRALHALPMLVFSLVTVIATVTLTSLAVSRKNEGSIMCKKKCPSLRAVKTALREKWAWPLMACIVNWFLWIVWGHVFPILTTVVGYPTTVVVTGVGVVVEVYLMAVLSLSLVVSVEEEWAGLDLVSFGSDIMKERKVCGWVLSGLVLLGTNCIGREMVRLIDGHDSKINRSYTDWTVKMRVASMIWLVFSLGWVVMWSNVVFTVFYCDWRKRNLNREPLEKALDNDIEN